MQLKPARSSLEVWHRLGQRQVAGKNASFALYFYTIALVLAETLYQKQKLKF